MSQNVNTHADVVAVFNRLGYSATFAQVARVLRCSPDDLYCRYASCEALAEAWLAGECPPPPALPGVGGMYVGFMDWLLGRLDQQRDFCRAWLAALTRTGPLHLPQLRDLHEWMHRYFCTWLDDNHEQISLPPGLSVMDASSELADLLCLISAALLGAWQLDRSPLTHNTHASALSIACLLDGLLTRRAEFGDAGLLVHLHRLLAQPHAQFLQPLLDTVLKGERARRFASPVNLVEALRNFLPPVAAPD